MALVSLEGHLVQYDGEVLLSCFMAMDHRYVGVAIQNTSDDDWAGYDMPYLLVKIKEKDRYNRAWNDYVEGRRDLLSFFDEAEEGDFFKIDLNAANEDSKWKLVPLNRRPIDIEKPAPMFMVENHTEDYSPAHSEIEIECRKHFNEPVIALFSVGRLVGYGATARDSYYIIAMPTQDHLVWHSCVGGILFLNDQVKYGKRIEPDGQDWNYYVMLDEMLGFSKAKKAAEFVRLINLEDMEDGQFLDD